VNPEITPDRWIATRKNASVRMDSSFENRKAATVIGDYNPSKYLLSHATIVASVDVANSSEPLGRQIVDGVEIDRRFSDFLITKPTERYINANFDSFERRLLLSTFKTFVGAESYVEHMQIPALSKGKIVDAVARDIGDSIYIDILVANDLKHEPLIHSIRTGELNTLSMGANVLFTLCSICGNVAEDETQLCTHIRNFKGQEFQMADGSTRIAAEICGHISNPDSCRFIEASWVADPAFKGAVLRGIVSPEGVSAEKIHKAFTLPQLVFDPHTMQKAASKGIVFPVNFGTPARWGKATVTEDPSSWTFQPRIAKEDNLEAVVEDVYNTVKKKLTERIKKDLETLGEQEEKKPEEPENSGDALDEVSDNDTLIRTACKDVRWRRIASRVSKSVPKKLAKRVMVGLILLRSGGWGALVKSNFSGDDLLRVSYVKEKLGRKEMPAGMSRIYQTVRKVGGTRPFSTEKEYLAACASVMGRNPTLTEAKELIHKGKIYSLSVFYLYPRKDKD